MNHIVLLGDSIFDNGSYVRGENDVAKHLKDKVLPRDKVTLLAKDGAVITSVHDQIINIPDDMNALFLSVGGNDLLQYRKEIESDNKSTLDSLTYFSQILDDVRTRYVALIKIICKKHKNLTLCTIYNGNLGAPLHKPASVLVALFNDIIYRTAMEFRLPVLELRDIFQTSEDYANPIEPSSIGGEKLALAIWNIV